MTTASRLIPHTRFRNRTSLTTNCFIYQLQCLHQYFLCWHFHSLFCFFNLFFHFFLVRLNAYKSTPAATITFYFPICGFQLFVGLAIQFFFFLLPITTKFFIFIFVHQPCRVCY